jgi:hypothetical protein
MRVDGTRFILEWRAPLSFGEARGFAKMLIVAAGVCGSVVLAPLYSLFDVIGRQHADDLSSAFLWLLGGDDGVAVSVFREASNHRAVRPSLIRSLGVRDVTRCESGRTGEAFGPWVEQSRG